jgi:hypothetical protein
MGSWGAATSSVHTPKMIQFLTTVPRADQALGPLLRPPPCGLPFCGHRCTKSGERQYSRTSPRGHKHTQMLTQSCRCESITATHDVIGQIIHARAKGRHTHAELPTCGVLYDSLAAPPVVVGAEEPERGDLKAAIRESPI